MEADIGQYEVLQGEKFSHMTEPIISFAQKAIWINMGCLNRLPDTLYVYFLLFRHTRRLIIRPGAEGEQDAVRWCTPSGKPRKIICETDFWNNITALMGWNDHTRYRLLGRFVHASDWDGLAFDLTRAELFLLSGAESKPEMKQNSAPVTWDEHRQNPLVNRFEEDTVIPIEER